MVDALLPLDTTQRPPGWYLFEHDSPGSARLELVVGEGASRATWSIDPARKRSVLLLERPASGAFLSAANVPPARTRLSPIGRLQALRHMLGDGDGLAASLAGTGMFLVDVLMRGMRPATRRLYARHRGGFASPAAPLSSWRLRERLLQLRPHWLEARPAHQLAGGCGDAWVATGPDPYFFISRARGGVPVLRGGWYAFSGRLEADGPANYLKPSLYYRIAGRMQPLPLQVPLPEPRADGRISALLRFDGDVEELRFDPTEKPATFRLRGMALRKLSRTEWMIRSLLGMRDASGARNWGLAGATIRRMWAAWRGGGGAGGAGAVLGAAYNEANERHSRSYAAWVHRYDTFTARDLAALARVGTELADAGPLVSILLPVYNTPEHWLRRCIESVLAQAYPKWELCIANDASTEPHVERVLGEFARRDPRIRVECRARNGHIAAASSTALAMARGDYVALLDHDDELRPHALLEVVEALQATPGARLVYSDEDKIDARGRRFQPYFKPDWNPDLLLSQNYLCHLTVIETALARDSGGFREGSDGSQDHDLFLRCSASLDAGQIRHVPKILYHWRAIEGSTALRRDAKDYAAEAGMRAVDDHLRAHSPGARVEGLAHGHFRIRWPLPSPQPKVSIVVPTRDRMELLRQCVESVLGKTVYDNFELVVVDNGSRDPKALAYLASLRGRERVRVLSHDAPFNFSRINNQAVAQCDGELLCLLNNDIEVIEDEWLLEMASQAWRPGVGAVGALLLYPDDSIQHAGVILGLGGVANHAYCHQPFGVPGHGARALVAQALSAVTGACLVVRRSTYLEAGGLDEKLQVAFNDVDFCLRLREMGYRNVWTPFARLYHHESASRGAEDTAEKVARFNREVALMRERWAGVLDHDPAYNPNLSLVMEETASELAFPPRGPSRGANPS